MPKRTYSTDANGVISVRRRVRVGGSSGTVTSFYRPGDRNYNRVAKTAARVGNGGSTGT